MIGMDIHRTFAEVVVWEEGRLRPLGRVDMTRAALEGFGKRLQASDEVVVEATGNAMAVVRVLSPFVARVIIANPLQVKAIAYAHVKTDKINAGVLANLYAAGFLPEVWTPDADTEQLRRLVARRNQVVKHRTRIKNEVHAILHAHLIPRCPHVDLFNRRGREWLARQPLPCDETAAIERHVRELDRLGEDLVLLDREVAQAILGNPAAERLITITGVNVVVAAGLVAAIGDIRRFASPQKLVSYLGLNPRVRQSGLGLAQHGRISKVGRSHARAMLVEAAWAAKAAGPLRAFFIRIRARRGHQVAAVAVARKLTVPCWHLLAKQSDYLWARPALVANKKRSLELQAGRPAKKGNQRGSAYAYNVKALRTQEMVIAEQAERAYERFVSQWRPRGPGRGVRERLKRQGTNDQAAWRGFQPMPRSSPRGRPRADKLPRRQKIRLSTSSVLLFRRWPSPGLGSQRDGNRSAEVMLLMAVRALSRFLRFMVCMISPLTSNSALRSALRLVSRRNTKAIGSGVIRQSNPISRPSTSIQMSPIGFRTGSRWGAGRRYSTSTQSSAMPSTRLR